MWKSETFSSLEDKLKINVKGNAEGGNFSLIGFTENGDEKTVYEKKIAGNFDFSYEFDPVSLAIYSGLVKFYTTISGDCRVDLWSVKEVEDTRDSARDSECVIKNGFVPVKQENGEEILVSVIPKKVLFVGNSILLGMFSSYGMCATDKYHDYAYLVSKRITEDSPECSFARLYASPFEHCVSEADFDEWFYNAVNTTTEKETFKNFESDLDLIVFQLMDNVNTPEKTEAFKKNMPELLARVKKLSPKARIVWVYGWFMKRDIVDFIKESCAKWNIETLDVSSARTLKNQAISGQTSFSPEGEKITVKDTWITHPGDGGMAAIADLMIKKIFGN